MPKLSARAVAYRYVWPAWQKGTHTHRLEWAQQLGLWALVRQRWLQEHRMQFKG